ncbi:hypothetical protein C8R43DRAFT_1129207 [Mycena crocata]|nr:hypothetical protein C8R43DRAFT_1129207 [Mycena crocata]
MSYPAESGGVMTHQNARTIGRVLQDLATWAEILEDKNGALTLVAWQALGLLLDIEARKTKMLLLGLCRTTSNDPRTYYKLKEACVVPVADFKHLSPNPARMLKEQEEKLPKDLIGAIGAMMVVNVEQAEDDPRPVLEAASKFSTIMCTPLGVFDAFRTDFQPLGQYTEAKWKASFSNVLRGGLFTTPFRRTP